LREERWSVASTEERRAALGAAFQHVVIAQTRSKQWSAERIEIVWREGEPEDVAEALEPRITYTNRRDDIVAEGPAATALIVAATRYA